MSMPDSNNNVAFCETSAHVNAVLEHCVSSGIDCIVLAVTVEAFHECERRGIACQPLDAFGNIASMTPVEGPANIRRVEDICSVFDEHLYRIGHRLPEVALVSFRAFFHPLKGFADSLTLRLVPMLKALNEIAPKLIIGFQGHTYPVPGVQLLDKPPFGLVTALLPILSEHLQIPVRFVACVEGANKADAPNFSQDNVLAGCNETSFVRRCKKAAKRAMFGVLNFRKHFTFPVPPETLRSSWASFLASRQTESIGNPTLLTMSSSLDDYLGPVLRLWDEKGFQKKEYMPGISLPPSLESGLSAECRRVLQRVTESFLQDHRLQDTLCVFYGVDLSSYIRPFLEKLIADCLFDMLMVANSGRAYYAGCNNAVLLFGGITHSHFVLARAARAEGIPIVSSHKGGFLGYSYLPNMERYDLAECDYFCCNGPGAAATFRQSHPEAMLESGNAPRCSGRAVRDMGGPCCLWSYIIGRTTPGNVRHVGFSRG
jgi:hypothetical protein